MTELEWTSYQYQKDKMLAGEICARLEKGNGTYLLNREQMVFVLEALEHQCISMIEHISNMTDQLPISDKELDFWTYVINLMECELDDMEVSVDE